MYNRHALLKKEYTGIMVLAKECPTMKDRILQAALLGLLIGSYVKTLPGVSVFSVGVSMSVALVALSLLF